MKKKFKMLAMFLSVALMMCCGLMLIGCNDKKEEKTDSKFTFSGEATISEKAYSIELKGIVSAEPDKGNFEMWVSGIPVPLEGTYQFVAKKGYIFNFADASDTVIKTHYDASSKKFYFDYFLNIGSSNGGIGRIRLFMEDAAFASSYDNEDWAWDFVWFGEQKSVMISGNDCTFMVTCKADGTFTTVPTSKLAPISPRNGTWTFNAESNKYTFTCDTFVNETSEYTSTYSETTSEYSITMDFFVGANIELSASYKL